MRTSLNHQLFATNSLFQHPILNLTLKTTSLTGISNCHFISSLFLPRLTNIWQKTSSVSVFLSPELSYTRQQTFCEVVMMAYDGSSCLEGIQKKMSYFLPSSVFLFYCLKIIPSLLYYSMSNSKCFVDRVESPEIKLLIISCTLLSGLITCSVRTFYCQTRTSVPHMIDFC